MKHHIRILVALLVLATIPAGARHAGAQDGAGGYTPQQVRSLVRDMAHRQAIDPYKISDLLLNLDRGMADPWFVDQARRRKIRGALMFEGGKGGLIVGYMEGRGLACFAGGQQNVPLYLKSVSVGAQIGGGGIWGAGVIVDLDRPRDFGGDYDGKVDSAMAGDLSSYNWVVLRNNKVFHEVLMLFTGRGLSAGYSAERLTITPDWR